MVVAGIDVGAVTTKIVVMNEQQIEGSIVAKSGVNIEKTVRNYFEEVLKNAGYQLKEVSMAEKVFPLPIKVLPRLPVMLKVLIG
jgi:activator of 2-hydroxyglutaryl-CoA dehydratase